MPEESLSTLEDPLYEDDSPMEWSLDFEGEVAAIVDGANTGGTTYADSGFGDEG